MKKIKELYYKIPPYLRNKYALTLIFFVVWMLFLDKNNMLAQLELSMELSDMEDKKEYYQDQLKEVQQTKEELFTNQATIEKFAREQYMMKKDNEDIFIIVEE